MTPTTSIRNALTDPALLGNTLVGDSWLPWRVLLIAAMGEALDDKERVLFGNLHMNGLMQRSKWHFYSISSSARPLSASETAMPSALAVFRLM